MQSSSFSFAFDNWKRLLVVAAVVRWPTVVEVLHAHGFHVAVSAGVVQTVVTSCFDSGFAVGEVFHC